MPKEDESDSAHHHLLLSSLFFCFLVLFKGSVVEGDTLQTDREVLLNLKQFLEAHNHVNRGRYAQWDPLTSSSPCDWPGISCTTATSTDLRRVTAVNLSSSTITGEIFTNFSALTELSYLDLSNNTLGGRIPPDFSSLTNLRYLNLSHNIISGDLTLLGLTRLEVLDLSQNRIAGEIRSSFPAICDSLRVLNISANNFTGDTSGCFDHCRKLEHLDLSANHFTGNLWSGFATLKGFSVSENNFSGELSPSFLTADNCSLLSLDLSENNLTGTLPDEISKCKGLIVLNLWGNRFEGLIPSSFGSISTLEALILGKNNFSREIPRSLLKCSKLVFLELSDNGFGGEIPRIFGEFKQLKFLVLHSNSFTGGIYSSGILKLPNISRLDLSLNKFTGKLPVEISEMESLQFLVLAFNQFSGEIPEQYGNLKQLQALDLSFNRLRGGVPPSLGKLTSLLWLMLANNSLSGEIPPDLGNCSSLLWLNLANNRLQGEIPLELTRIGANPMPTFMLNRQTETTILPGSGECLVMKRWIFADYPPFSFAYTLLTRKSCRSIWDRLLKGYGLFPICLPGSSSTKPQISGYLQLSGNRFTGKIPSQIGGMHSFSMIHLGDNRFSGGLPSDIGNLPLVVLNVSENGFSGGIPTEIGKIQCLQNLDLSYNNFSGVFPTSLNNLNELSKFNVSYNPFISGVIPNTGQLSTFGKESYLGDPLLFLPSFISNSSSSHSSTESEARVKKNDHSKRPRKLSSFTLFLIFLFAFLLFGAISIVVISAVRKPSDTQKYLLGSHHSFPSSSSSNTSSYPWLASDRVKVIRLIDIQMAFTYDDILKATANFSDERIIGTGGFGTVYKGTLPDGRKVAIKKLQREGIEGEREFRAEMEMVSGNLSSVWPHPNLVTLYGWCLYGSQKILIYEYMEGGSLENLIPDKARLTWKQRIQVAIDVARALVFLHHECYPAIVHRDVKASNVLLDEYGKARITDFGLARVVESGDSHVSTMVAGTVGYVAPEYSQTWQATTKGDVYSFGVLAMELATGRKAVDVGEEECLVEWARRVSGGENGQPGLDGGLVEGLIESGDGMEEMCGMLDIGIKCTSEAPQVRPNMKCVLDLLAKVSMVQKGDVVINCEPLDDCDSNCNRISHSSSSPTYHPC